jgi:sugar lactone lactonase YvrE
MACALGIAIAAALAVTPERSFAQSVYGPNDAPNPYKYDYGWAKLPDGRKWGAAVGVAIDRDGKSVWVFDRCESATDCSKSKVDPIMKFDSSGRMVKSFGGGLFNYPHGLHIDPDNNVWVTDGRAMDNGKGHTVMKFSQDGDLLMTLGKPGVAGTTKDTFNAPSDVLVAPNGDIFVADGHGGDTNNRIVKFSKDGKYIKEWGRKGTGPGEFNVPHRLAMDSAGRLFVADRSNNRIQAFDQDGTYLFEWKQFGSPSGLFIDRNDILYVADNSPDERNPPYRSGIRVGSVKDGVVTAFILEAVEVNGVEAVAVDDAGNVYGGYTNTLNLRRWVKKPGAAAAQAAAEPGHAPGVHGPNDAPNPYKFDYGWAKLPDGRKWGAAVGVAIDRDGKSVWVFDRCETANDCSRSKLDPIMKFDSTGKVVSSFGSGLFNYPHGLHVDADNNIWVTDARGENGKGHTVMKFSQDGKLLMTLGKPGVAGTTKDTFNAPSDVLVAPSGDIFVADGHGGDTNNRIVKFNKDGKYIKEWGRKGSGPGEFNVPHRLAMDSAGRLFVADRSNNRIQAFDQDGNYLLEWKQFGSPSGLFIDRNDTLFVADASTDEMNPPYKSGIRIGSARDGVVTGFIRESVEVLALEAVAVDDAGIIYGGYTNTLNFRRWVKKQRAASAN